MKHSRLLLLILPLLMLTTACHHSGEDTSTTIGNWIRTTPFKGSRRSGAIVFTINNKAYVGLGYDGDKYFTDFYEYDLDLGFWQTKASFPGIPRERAVAFSIDGVGYIGTGYNRDQPTEQLNDFWKYDPGTDTWTQLNNFGGSARYNAVAFAVGSKGYLGTGNDGANWNGDFWEYNPADDSWQEIVSYPGQKREESTSFVIDNKAYIITGRNNGVTDLDFFSFDPSTKTWTKLTPTDDVDYYAAFGSAARRYQAVGFTLNGMGYITTGITSTGTNDATVYQYNPSTQEWIQMQSFEGSARSEAIAFVVNSRIFVGTGQSGASRYDDIWEFRPDEDYNQND